MRNRVRILALSGRQLGYAERSINMRTDLKSVLIGALLVAVVTLGYLLWDRQRNTVEIRLPSVSIDRR
jgi:hypothetical protein